MVIALLALTGCALQRAEEQVPAVEGHVPAPAVAAKQPEREALPDLSRQSRGHLTRDQVRDGLLQWMNEPGTQPAEQLRRIFANEPRNHRTDIVPWVEADLSGDGESEFVLALAVTDQIKYSNPWRGAALFVIYRAADGGYAVDRSDRLPDAAEIEMMGPSLHGVTDLAGLGRPQIIWSRPHSIATGPQPFSVIVTTWEPGRFTHLPGEMVISRTKEWSLQIDGADLVLFGGSRNAWFYGDRTDRYRFVDGAFRLVDRQVEGHGFWPGVIAESVGRVDDAEREYRMALEMAPAETVSVPQYKSMPKVLTPAEVEAFNQAERAFARFRLGGLLLQAGRVEEARAVLEQEGGPFVGLTRAMLEAESREAGCGAAAMWAKEEPAFLAAYNAGRPHPGWSPEDLCTHVLIDDCIHWNE